MRISRVLIVLMTIIAWGGFMGYVTDQEKLQQQIGEQRAKEAERQKHKFIGLTAPRYD